jgi:ATP-dependent Zn protease
MSTCFCAAYSQAAIQASKQGYHEVMLKHFEWAKDRIIMGSERKSAYIDEKNKLMTAYHEVRYSFQCNQALGANCFGWE